MGRLTAASQAGALTKQDITDRLAHWRERLLEAQNDGDILDADLCRRELDRWLEELLLFVPAKAAA
jgi:hypothetical protein